MQKHKISKTTGKPQYNKSKGTKDFVLYSRGFVMTGFFTIRLTTSHSVFSYGYCHLIIWYVQNWSRNALMGHLKK